MTVNVKISGDVEYRDGQDARGVYTATPIRQTPSRDLKLSSLRATEPEGCKILSKEKCRLHTEGIGRSF